MFAGTASACAVRMSQKYTLSYEEVLLLILCWIVVIFLILGV